MCQSVIDEKMHNSDSRDLLQGIINLRNFFSAMFAFIPQAVLSFLRIKPRSTMVDAEELLLNLATQKDTGDFLYIILTWASNSTNPQGVLDRFDVVCIRHNKNPEPPEHEYLIIETQDRVQNGKVQHFILERTVSSGQEVPPRVMEDDRREKLLGTLHQITKVATSAITSAMGPSQLASMEEGSNLNRLSTIDEMTLASTQIADLVSDSVRNSNSAPATDRFSGEGCMKKQCYHGQNVQYFKPNRLTLFEFALLAHYVHEKNPYYSLLYTQCYFYAALVYAAAQSYGGVLASENADKTQNDMVQMCGSHLTDKHGRCKGVKVLNIDADSPNVKKLIEDYKQELRKELDKVFLMKVLKNCLLLPSQIYKTRRAEKKLENIKDIIEEVCFSLLWY